MYIKSVVLKGIKMRHSIRFKRTLIFLMIFLMIISSFEPFASTYSSVSYGTSEQTAEADEGVGGTEQNPDGSSADAPDDAAAEDKGSAEAKPDEDSGSGEAADTDSEADVPKGEQAPEKSDKSDNEGDKLEYRELDVVVSEDTYTEVEKSGKYAGKELPTYAFSFMSRFWKALSGEAAELPTEDEIKARAKRNVPVKVSVKGLVPEKIHAEVKYIEFSSENEKEKETEKG